VERGGASPVKRRLPAAHGTTVLASIRQCADQCGYRHRGVRLQKSRASAPVRTSRPRPLRTSRREMSQTAGRDDDHDSNHPIASSGAHAATSKGRTAPLAKLPADASAACKRARLWSRRRIPIRRGPCSEPKASCAISCAATCEARLTSRPPPYIYFSQLAALSGKVHIELGHAPVPEPRLRCPLANARKRILRSHIEHCSGDQGGGADWQDIGL